MDALKFVSRSAAIGLATGCLVLSSFSWAVSPTPAQIEQFKRLPPEQQQQLAKSYGVTLPTVTKTVTVPQPSQPAVEPRPVTEAPAPKTAKSTNVVADKKDEQVQETKLKRFGYDLFAATPTTFAQVANVPVPSNYTLGPGDTLKVQFFGKTSDQFELQIDRDGNVDFPELGPISLAGQTFSEARETLTTRVKEQIIGVRTSITMGELRSIQVFVLGDAYTPGLYTISALSNISHALYQSGGIATTGSLRHIQLKRSGKVVAELDLYDLLLKGDTTNDARLLPGDVVFIPPTKGAVAVDGEVRRPAIYEIKQGETVGDAIRMAGGMLPDAFPKQSLLTGYDEEKIKQVTSLDLTKASSLKKTVATGDYIEVRSAKETVENGVLLVGAIAHPGFYAFKEGMRVSNLLPSVESSLLPGTDLDYALIVTEHTFKSEISVRQFNLGKALANPGTEQDLQLGNKDKIVVFNRLGVVSEKESARAEGLLRLNNATPAQRRGILTAAKNFSRSELLNPIIRRLRAQAKSGELADVVSVTGTVKDSGQYPLISGARISDLIAATGGLQVDTELEFALLISTDVETGDISVTQIDLNKVIESPNSAENRELTRLDNLMVFNRKSLNKTDMLAGVVAQLRKQAQPGEFAKVVTLTGAVKDPGTYPLTEGAKLTDLITAAGGMIESADVTKAEISRTKVIEGESADYIHFSASLADAQKNADQNPILHARDIVNVMTVPEWRDNPVITVRGEVKYPGTYTIKRGETILDVLARVGGFTQFADIDGVIFTRDSIRHRQKEQLDKLGQQLRKQLASLSLRTNKGTNSAPLADYETMQKLIADMSAVEPVGRLVIDMPAIVSGDNDYNIALENGDALYVPPRRSSVNVIGEVQLEGTHFYKSNLDMKDYLARSGGMKAQADDGRVYIIKANGEVVIPSSYIPFIAANANMEPGDTIVVPLNVEYMDGLTLWSSVTQILYNTAVAAAAIGSL